MIQIRFWFLWTFWAKLKSLVGELSQMPVVLIKSSNYAAGCIDSIWRTQSAKKSRHPNIIISKCFLVADCGFCLPMMVSNFSAKHSSGFCSLSQKPPASRLILHHVLLQLPAVSLSTVYHIHEEFFPSVADLREILPAAKKLVLIKLYTETLDSLWNVSEKRWWKIKKWKKWHNWSTKKTKLKKCQDFCTYRTTENSGRSLRQIFPQSSVWWISITKNGKNVAKCRRFWRWSRLLAFSFWRNSSRGNIISWTAST